MLCIKKHFQHNKSKYRLKIYLLVECVSLLYCVKDITKVNETQQFSHCRP